MSSARIAGLVAVLVLALLFAATLLVSLGSEDVVVPTNGPAAGKRDNPGGQAALGELQARTRVQEYTGNTERPPGGKKAAAGEQPSLALGPARKENGELVRQWLGDRDQNKDILDPAQFRRGIATVPGNERGVLVQPQGRTWRNTRNDQLAYGGGFYIFGLSLLIALFLAWRGRIPLKEGESGVAVLRFSAFERANHWLTALSFLLMALTGLVILYGNALIRPWLGADAYAGLAQASAWSHMAFAVPFVIGVLVMIALWTRQNLPERLDWYWLKRGGGFLSDRSENPPARRFNAGQKIVFWGVVLGGLFLTLTGIGMMFPFYWAGYTGMQTVQFLHAAAALLMIGLIIGHIYIGTIGMVGAFEAMWSGRVDRNWAHEHHSLWYRNLADQRAPEASLPPASTAHANASAMGSFATGVVLAVLIAIAMTAIYGLASITSSTSTQNAAVHLDQSDIALERSGSPNLAHQEKAPPASRR